MHIGWHFDPMMLPQHTSPIGQSSALEQESGRPMHIPIPVQLSFTVIPTNVTQHTCVAESHVVMPH